jgi:hypothetical protein
LCERIEALVSSVRPATELKGLTNNPLLCFQMAELTVHVHATLRASTEPIREHEQGFQSQHNQRPHRHAPYVFAEFSMLSKLLMNNKSIDGTLGHEKERRSLVEPLRGNRFAQNESWE